MLVVLTLTQFHPQSTIDIFEAYDLWPLFLILKAIEIDREELKK